MRMRVTVACCLVLLAAGTARTDGQSPLPAVPSPDLNGLEPAVAEQLRGLQQIVADTAADGTASATEMSDGYGELGRHYQAYGLDGAAEEAYGLALERTPDRFDWWYLLGRLLLAQGRLDEAEEALGRARRIRPQYVPVQLALADLYLQENRLADTEETLERAGALAPDSPAVEAATGELALAQGDYATAVARLTRALRSVPEARRLHYPLAMAYRGLGQMEEAREQLAQMGPVGIKADDPLLDGLQDLERGATLFILRGKRAYRVGRYADAAAAFGQAVEVDPENVSAHVNLGVALAAMGDRQTAIDELESAVALDTENATAWFNLGTLRASRGELQRAQAALARAVELEPDDSQAEIALGNVLLRLDRPGEALGHYRRASSLASDSESAILGVADALVRLRRYSEALADLGSANERMPTSGLIARALSRMLTECPDQQLRDGARALPLAQRVYEAQPSAGNARTVALAFAEQGRCESAVDWRDRALATALETNESGLAAALTRLLQPYGWTDGCPDSGPP